MNAIQADSSGDALVILRKRESICDPSESPPMRLFGVLQFWVVRDE